MTEASLVRSVRFSAGHRYWRDDWSDEENRRVFGPASNPHGHNYLLEVTVRGPIDPDTGFVVDLGALDGLLAQIVDPLDSQDLNQAIPEVRKGEMVPTTENLARWFWHQIEPRVPDGGRLVKVRVAESESLAAEYVGGRRG